MTDQQPPAEMPPASESSESTDIPPATDAPEPMMEASQPPMEPAEPTMAPEAPVPAAPPAPTGWVQAPAATPPPPGQWVMPPAVATRGGVTGLAKLGALVLIVFGVLWALLGVLIILSGSVVTSLPGFGDQIGNITLSSLTSIIVGVGIVILFIALVEVLAGIFAWRGSGLARFIGMVYGFVFGLGTLLSVTQAGASDVQGAQGGSLFLLVFAVGYLYVLIVFLLRWRHSA
jgi:hypothetical protein